MLLSVVNEKLSRLQFCALQVADEIFRLAMIDFKIDSRIAGTMYEAVHLGGGAAWKENADAKAKGEKRILKSLPDDPRITWSEWRARPEVFE